MDEESLECLTKKVAEHGRTIVREPYQPDYSHFPQVGEKLKFKGVPSVYYPMFTNIGKFAKDNLVVGSEYQVSKVEVYSSWCAVWLNGFGENFFHATFFGREKK